MNLKLPFDYRISECLNEREKLIKRFKYYSLLIFHLFYFIQCMFIYNELETLNSNEIPLYYFGICHHLGGLSQFYYLVCAFISLNVIQYLYIFNRSHELRHKWIKIIEVLNTDSQSIHTLGITDKNSRETYLKHVIFIQKCVNLIVNPTTIFTILTFISILLSKLSFIDFITYGIITIILASIFVWSFYNSIFYGCLHLFIVCYFCKLKFISFYSKLNQLTKIEYFINHMKVLKILNELDQILKEIIEFNHFWKAYIFSVYFTVIPILLLVLQSLLFVQEQNFLLVILINLIIFYSTIIIGFNLITSSINKQSIITFKFIHIFYVNNENVIKTNIKIKVFFIEMRNKLKYFFI